jgi:outer membrane autotransporter protein
VVQTQPLAAVAQPGNQQSVAEVIENLPQTDPIPVAVLNLPDVPAAQSAFDQLSGQIQASAKSALIAHAIYVRDATFDRLRDSYCDEDRRERPRPGCSWDGPSLWAQGYGGWGGISGNTNAMSLNHSTAGFLIGFDIPVADWRVGLFGGRSQSDLHLTVGDAAGETTDFHLGGYAGTRWDNISLRLGASYSWDGITANRSVAFGSFSNQLRSVYKAGTAQGFAELGYRMQMWAIRFEPFANLAYVNVRTDDFREVGGPAALTVRADTLENLVSTLGVRPSTDVIVDGAELTLRGLAGWRHTFGSVTPRSTMAFGGGSDFTITGAPLARDAMALEAGMDFTVRDNVSAGLTYGSQLSSRTTDQMLRGTIRVAF